MNTIEEKPLIEKTVAELILDQNELAAIRHRYAQEKMALQGQLISVNAEIKTKCKQTQKAEFHRLNKHRSNILRSLSEKENDITLINQHRAEVQAVIDVRKQQQFGIKQIKELIAVRDRWHEFSMEKANHQKAREVAFKVSQELRELLKPYFEGMGA
jgi:hypothetical protein